MRRVGSLSMGVTLILIGIYLGISTLLSWGDAFVILKFWPLVLIVLGGEILYFNRQTEEKLKYDFVSLFYVFVLVGMSVLFHTVASLGLIDVAQKALTTTVRDAELPVYEASAANVKKIVFVGERADVRYEKTEFVTVFGTYRQVGKQKMTKGSDYVGVKRVGETLYVTLREQPSTPTTIAANYINPIVVVPVGVKVE